MLQLAYAATPARLKHKIEEIMDYMQEEGQLPFHPFIAFPYERYEGDERVGREPTMTVCCRAIEMCDEFWIFGISEGTLIELTWVLQWNADNPTKVKTIRLLHEEFDPEWQKYYEQYKNEPRFNDPLERIPA